MRGDAGISMRLGVGEPATEIRRCRAQPLIARPQCCAMGQRRRHQQVDIDIANACSMQAVAFDETQKLVVLRHRGRRQFLKQLQRRRSARQTAAGDFAHDERVHHHAAPFQQRSKLRITASQVIDPHRRIDEDQDSAG